MIQGHKNSGKSRRANSVRYNHTCNHATDNVYPLCYMYRRWVCSHACPKAQKDETPTHEVNEATPEVKVLLEQAAIEQPAPSAPNVNQNPPEPNPALPKEKPKLHKSKKQYRNKGVRTETLVRFATANGYDIVVKQGICAAAKASGVSFGTVRSIIRQFPPKQPYIRTNFKKRKTGEHNNKKRLSAFIRPSTLKRFKDANGFEIAKTQGMTAAAAASGLHICSVSKILHQAKCTQIN